jgi:hypothetical protein
MISNRFSEIFSARPLSWGVGLFFLAIYTYFFALPLQSDITTLIAAMAALALMVAKTQKLFPQFREPALQWLLAAFGVFVLAAFIASLLNLPTMRYFPRILLWLGCVFSGAVFALAFPRNGGRYLWAVFAGGVARPGGEPLARCASRLLCRYEHVG